MNLRSILFVVSILIIGLCLSLYFQGEQPVQSVNWDQYKNVNYTEERSHSLDELNKKLAPIQLEGLIQEIFERNRLAGEKTRVMEIGPGNGRVLMTLKARFPEIEFYGINKEKTHSFYRRESYILTALKFNILTKAQLQDIELPYIVFQDLDFGQRIPYADAKFDLVFSQDTIAHIKYKFELFNEIMRVLKPRGLSLHTDFSGANIYGRGVVVGLREAFQEMKKRGIDISQLEDERSIRFRKKDESILFPVTPHQNIPETLDRIPDELKRPEMGYNLNY